MMLMTLVEIGRWVAFIGSGYLLGGLLFEFARGWIDRRKSRKIRDDAERPLITTTTTPPPKEDS